MVFISKVASPFLFYSTEDAIKSFIGTGPAAAALNHVNERTLEKAIATALQPFQLNEDMYHLQNSFLFFIAAK